MECVQRVLQKQINKIVIMLSPRLTNCPECSDIPSLLKKIDCKLAELGNNLYNNISYMLNKRVPVDDITQLIGYRRILMYKLINPSYVQKYSINMIASKVIRLTVGCVSRCNTPEPCIEESCDITIVPNPTTTTSTTITPIPTTTTTSSSSTSTTSSTSTSTTLVPTTTTTSSSSSSSSTTTTTTTFIPPGAVPIPILLGYQTISPVEDIVVSNTFEDACIFANNYETSNVNVGSYVLDSTTYYFDNTTSMLYNSVTNTFAEDGYYISDSILYVTNGLAEIISVEDFYELCFTITTTTSSSSSSTSTSSTSTTSSSSTTSTTTTACVNRPVGLTNGNLIQAVNNPGDPSRNFSNVSVAYACDTFNYFRSVPMTTGSGASYIDMQYSTLAIGEVIYNDNNGTNCVRVANGFYWFQPNIISPITYFKGINQISIVTIVGGVITAIDICDYVPPTTTTTTTI